jgi:hypothetical protein
MLRSKVITSASEFQRLEQDWRLLTEQMEQPEIFDCWEWSSLYLKHLCDESDRLFVVVVYDGELCVGIAPMRLQERKFRKLPFVKARVLEPIDSVYRDYCRFYLHRGYHYGQLIDLLVEEMIAGSRDWDYIELRNFNSRDPVTMLVRDKLARKLDIDVELGDMTPYVDYRQLSRGKTNKSRIGAIERKERKLVRECDCRIRVSQPFDEATWLKMVELHLGRWGETSVFRDAPLLAFWRELLTALDASDRLEFSFLEIEGRLAAAHMGFRNARKIYYYTPALNPEFADRGPGLILLKHLMKHYDELGAEEFDFLRGDESYKFYWADKAGTNHHIYAYRPGAARWLMKLYVRNARRKKTKERAG